MGSLVRRILITGASSTLGRIVRDWHRNDKVVISSRSTIMCHDNETFAQSADLLDIEFWSNFLMNHQFDMVYHFAEYKAQTTYFETIVQSHVKFLEGHQSKKSILIYPITAHLYDDWRAASSYREIKSRVMSHFSSSGDRIKFPVVHPILEDSPELKKLRLINSCIPMINIFSEFTNQFPISSIETIGEKLCCPKLAFGKSDIYDRMVSPSIICCNSHKFNVRWISKFIKMILRTFDSIGCIKLVLNGRVIS